MHRAPAVKEVLYQGLAAAKLGSHLLHHPAMGGACNIRRGKVLSGFGDSSRSRRCRRASCRGRVQSRAFATLLLRRGLCRCELHLFVVLNPKQATRNITLRRVHAGATQAPCCSQPITSAALTLLPLETCSLLRLELETILGSTGFSSRREEGPHTIGYAWRTPSQIELA